MPTRVYRYGLRPPTLRGDEVAEQMRNGHNYYNALIEIERVRRARVRAEEAKHADVEMLEALKSALDDDRETARDHIKRIRQQTRSRKATASHRERVKDLSDGLREVNGLLREARARLKDDAAHQAVLAAISKDANERRKRARAAAQCFWGTYLIQEQAADAAAKDSWPSDPDFRRWSGSGSVAVQIQGGLPVQGLQTSTWLQIDAPPKDAWERRRSPGRRTHVRMRIGSDGRAPVWAECPLLMHRPLPDGAIITWAKVHLRRRAAKDHWELHLTLKLPDAWRAEPCGKGTAAVDVGWRKRGDVLRVACVGVGEDEYEISLSADIIGAMRKVEDLQSIRAQRLNVMRDELWPWLRSNAPVDWLSKHCSHIWQWKSARRFAALARRWREQRWGGDDIGFTLLEEWRKKDKHLWTWQENQRKKVERRRLDLYRAEAARIARRCDTIVIERFDKRATQRTPAPESDKTENAAAKWQQRAACCSSLCDALINAMSARGGIVVEIAPEYTTQACHVCGFSPETPWDAAESIDHRCESCGALWDQDFNAARNLAQRYREWSSGNADPGIARATDYGNLDAMEAKWARLGRHKDGTARKPTDKSAE